MNAVVKSSATHKVVLPGGDEVEISALPLAWWTTNFASGFVAPELLAPDPKNPRRQVSPLEQKELDDSIVDRGVREPITVTPRSLATWAKVAPGDNDRFFLIVSGHRRRGSALRAKLKAVPIRVVLYTAEKDHRLDMSILNKGREELSELDQGFEIVELQKLGCTPEEMARAFGYTSTQQVYNRINLTRLDPDLQKLLHKDAPGKRQLSVTVGGILGGLRAPAADSLESVFVKFKELVPQKDIISREVELDTLSENGRRFALQRLLYAIIKRRGLNAQRAGELIREQTLRLHQVSSGSATSDRPVNTERYRPSKRKEILNNLIDQTRGSIVVDWSNTEFINILSLTSREEVEDILDRLTKCRELFDTLAATIERIRNNKKPTRPEVLQLMKQGRAPQKVAAE